MEPLHSHIADTQWEPMESLDRDRSGRKTEGGRPIFEIQESGRNLRIYANGVIEGFADVVRIVNHIPTAIRPEMARYFSKFQSLGEPYASPSKPKPKTPRNKSDMVGMCLKCSSRLSLCGAPFTADLECPKCGAVNGYEDSFQPVRLKDSVENFDVRVA